MSRSLYSIQSKIPGFLLALMILLYTGYFSWYTINRHNTLNSYAADLSLIDQPMWNSVLGPGDFMELTWGNRQQPRLAEHFEPILAPLAMLFFVWDNVRILLIAQSAALALGALPVFWIARQQLTLNHKQLSKGEMEGQATTEGWAVPWAALAFSLAYLLYPQLQAANVADFHADPFVVTPLLLAFWYASQKRWGWMWLWAAVAMLTKETLPPLTAMLGAWLLLVAFRQRRNRAKEVVAGNFQTMTAHGLALILISTLWFLIATFAIVAPLARQYFGVDGPIYFANRYSQGPASLAALLQDPARWRYFFGLLAAAGLLPLLAPELLVLGLPVLVANLLSNFPGQYSGEQHYSAPLVVAFMVAAIYGARRLVNRVPWASRHGQSTKTTALLSASLWLLVWSFSYHALHGWTPLSIRVESYRMSSAAARLPDLVGQVPPEAVVSASAAIHPHLAHRRIIYVFPTVQEAVYMLVDVTDIPGVHPNDARAQILDMLRQNWRPLAADQGLILAEKVGFRATTAKPLLPDPFYDFARTDGPPDYPVQVTFAGSPIRLLGYDVADDPDDGVTFRFYWQSSAPLPENLGLWPLVYNDWGQLLSNPGQVPQVAALWYPSSRWRPGEVVVTETLPQMLPDAFHLGIAVGPENSFGDPDRHYPITREAPGETWLHPAGRWLQLASFRRQGPFLKRLPATPTFLPLTPADALFGQQLRLVGFRVGETIPQPGAKLPLLLQWQADQAVRANFTIFVHLLASDGRLIAQSDAIPTWLTPAPTGRWLPDQSMPDRRVIEIPPDLPPGSYTLQVGIYNSLTLERLTLPDDSSTFLLGQIRIQ